MVLRDAAKRPRPGARMWWNQPGRRATCSRSNASVSHRARSRSCRRTITGISGAMSQPSRFGRISPRCTRRHPSASSCTSRGGVPRRSPGERRARRGGEGRTRSAPRPPFRSARSRRAKRVPTPRGPSDSRSIDRTSAFHELWRPAAIVRERRSGLLLLVHLDSPDSAPRARLTGARAEIGQRLIDLFPAPTAGGPRSSSPEGRLRRSGDLARQA